MINVATNNNRGWVLKSVLLIAVLLVVSLSVSGQPVGGSSAFDNVYDRDPNNNMGLTDTGLPEVEPDSLGRKKKVRVKKPLESYYFNDSIKANNVFSWRFNPYNNNIKIIPIDTALYNFQKDYVYMNGESVGSAYIGPLGAGSIPLNYFNRENNVNFSFLDAYSAYLYTSENVPFYNGKRPFTQLSFFMSGQMQKAEEQLRVIHSQNISPSTSFNVNYRNNYTRGMYANQKSKDKNLSLAFAHTGKKYSLHGGYIYNMGDVYENGGVVRDADITDTIIDLPENTEMRLKSAHNKFKGNTFYLTQSYAIPFRKLSDEDFDISEISAFFVGTSFEYTKYKKIYSDKNDGNIEYYKNWYIDPTMTRDSISESRIDAKGFIEIQPYNRDGLLGTVSGGVGYTHNKYYYFTPDQYLSPTDGVKRNTFYAYGNLQGQFKKYLKWNGEAKYYPAGYRSQDFSVKGELVMSAYIKNKPLSLSFDVHHNRQSPSFWDEQYYSNHYVWNNSFNKEVETRFRAKLLMEPIGTELGFEQSITSNKVYYNAESMPTQYSDAVSVTGVYLRKDFRLGGFHFNNRALLQWSTVQEVAPVPLLSANGTYYYEFNVVKNVLRMQVGVDGYYNTKYYGFGYNPALSQFYNQRETKVGDYLWMDAYISGKWKRVRFLLKLQHFNNNLFGGRNYFQVAHYPLNRRMLKFGVSWNFYD